MPAFEGVFSLAPDLDDGRSLVCSTAYALLMATIEMIDGANVEYLLRPNGRRLAVLFHGGHMRADLEIYDR